MKHFRLETSAAMNAHARVWAWQAEMKREKPSEFHLQSAEEYDLSVTSTSDRLGEAMLRQVLIEKGISYSEHENKPAIAKGFGKEEEKEESLPGWKEILTKDLYETTINCEGERGTAIIEYNGNFGFTLKKEAWEIYEKLADYQVDEKLRELGIDPEKGWN